MSATDNDLPNSVPMASTNRCSDSESIPPDMRLSEGPKSSPISSVISLSLPRTSMFLIPGRPSAAAEAAGRAFSGRSPTFRGTISSKIRGTLARVLDTDSHEKTFTISVE